MESAEEAAAIRRYLQKARPDLGSYIILAPYLMQIEQLRKLMLGERGNILTVHRAQGMEWDTVILSVCDTDFWGSERKQLISELIAQSTREA